MRRGRGCGRDSVCSLYIGGDERYYNKNDNADERPRLVTLDNREPIDDQSELVSIACAAGLGKVTLLCIAPLHCHKLHERYAACSLLAFMCASCVCPSMYYQLHT